jgi:hypothetical protein
MEESLNSRQDFPDRMDLTGRTISFGSRSELSPAVLNQEEIDSHCRQRQGLELAGKCFTCFKNLSAEALSETGIDHETALFMYGSAGGRHFLPGSDTDYILVGFGNGKTSKTLQEALEPNLSVVGDLWKVNFKSWAIVRGNPPELRSLRFLGGQKDLFLKTVYQDPSVIKLLTEDAILIAGIARSTLYSVFREEVEGNQGNVKYDIGGMRDVEAIYRGANLYADEIWGKFSATASLATLIEKGILDESETGAIEESLNFYLIVKQVLGRKHSIVSPDVQKLASLWDTSSEKVIQEYEDHKKATFSAVRKLEEKIWGDYPKNLGVRARFADGREAVELLDSGCPAYIFREIMITLALRTDITEATRKEIDRRISMLNGVDQRSVGKYLEWARSK